MKLFHTGKDGKKAVYVQMQDVSYLMSETDIPIPGSIVMKVYGKGAVIVNELKSDYNNMVYELKFLQEVYDVKHNAKTMPFPDFCSKDV